ncbi:hypothetical protein L7F22_000472 [Adiantum nelumboides]|nr:hypothetical protein [Adiantum nelumboides]
MPAGSQYIAISGLSSQTNEDQLRAAFSAFGEVSEARIVLDIESGKSKGYAFVKFACASHAEIAMKTMDGRALNGKILRVSRATERPRVIGGTGYDGRYSDGGDYGSYGQPTLQAKVQGQIQQLQNPPKAQQERAPDRPLNEASNKETSLGNELNEELFQQSTNDGVVHQELSKKRDGSDTPITSESDVAPRKRRTKQSLSPVKKKKRSSSTPSHANPKKVKDNSRWKKRRKQSPSSPSSLSSSSPSSYDESRDSLSKKTKGRGKRRSYAAWKRSKKLKKFKEEEKNITFFTYNGTFELLTKCWLSSNSLMRRLGIKNSLNIQSYRMFLYTLRNQSVNGGQAFMLKEKLQ